MLVEEMLKVLAYASRCRSKLFAIVKPCWLGPPTQIARLFSSCESEGLYGGPRKAHIINVGLGRWSFMQQFRAFGLKRMVAKRWALIMQLEVPCLV